MNFREFRKSRGLTQQEMAELFGITRSYYWALEKGERQPSETLLKMAALIEGNFELEKSVGNLKDSVIKSVFKADSTDLKTASFGERLRMIRKARGVNQGDLGHVVKRTAASVSDWEKGKSRPTLNDIEKLATELDCSPGLLAFGFDREAEESMESESYPYQERRLANMDDVYRFLDPWVRAAEFNANVAPIMLYLLRKNLPHKDLDRFKED